MKKLDMFFRLTKVGAEGIVEGVAVVEQPDKSGEIFDYASSKPEFQKWSGEFEKNTDGKSLGNIREMHNRSAVGVTKSIHFDDDNKLIRITAKVVDAAAKEKVLEGVYTGFSIGGTYGKTWADPDDRKLTRYTAIPSEISLVDNPCVPGATFECVKADGVVENRPFKIVTKVDYLNDENRLILARALSAGVDDQDLLNYAAGVYAEHPMIKALGTEATRDGILDVLWKIAARDDVKPEEGKEKYGDVEFADPKNKKYPIDTEAHIRAAWSYIHHPNNADKYSAEDTAAIKAKIVAAWKDKIDKDGPPSAGEGKEEKKAAPVVVPAAKPIKKGMGQVSCLANIIDQLCYLQASTANEAVNEADNSEIPGQLKDALETLGEILVDLAEEETKEINDGAEVSAPMYMAMSATLKKFNDSKRIDALKLDDATKASLQKSIDALIVKYGARHSKADMQHVQDAHDHMVKLGAMCKVAGDNVGGSATGATENKVPVSAEVGTHISASNANTGNAPQEDDEDANVNSKVAGGDLKKVQGELAKAQEQLTKITNERDAWKLKWESSAAPAKGKLRIVSKGDDYHPTSEAADAPSTDDLTKSVDTEVARIMALPMEARALEIMKINFRNQAARGA